MKKSNQIILLVLALILPILLQSCHVKKGCGCKANLNDAYSSKYKRK